MDQGSIIGERYLLERQIGQGGMAAVWLASDRRLRRRVAIKFLWARERPGHKDLVRGFLREARIAASVDHANVVQVLDFGLHEEDVPYMVMEALEGETLGDQFNAGAVYSIEQVVHIAAGTLEGIIAVHEAGIVHRDLKPENIFLVAQRNRTQPKLLDFGISRAVDSRSGLRSAVTTQEGRVIGTPEYMSPEQARGVTDIDQRTDIYSMGVILYEMIVGDVPYKAEHFGDLIIKIVQGGASPVYDHVPAVGRPMSDLIARAMAGERKARFATAADMYDALLVAAEPFGGAGAVLLGLPPRTERRRGTKSGLGLSTDEDLEMVLSDPITAGLSLDSLPPDRAVASASTGPSSAESPDSAPATPLAVQRPVPSTPSRASTGASRWLPMLAAVAVLGLAFVFFVSSRAAPDSGGPRYIVVQGTQQTPSSAAIPVAPPSDQVAAVDSLRVSPDASAMSRAGGASAATAPSSVSEAAAAQRVKASRTQLLAGAFKRQKGPVVGCFHQHADLEESSISVRVQVDVAGAVEASQVLPSAAAQTAAGRCVEAAVAKMQFGRQPAPASFRVPLFVTRTP